MFTPIIKNIEEKEYKLAVDALVPLLDEENERVVATAHYMLDILIPVVTTRKEMIAKLNDICVLI